MVHASGNDHHLHHIPSPNLGYRATIPRSQSGLRRYKTLNRPHLAHPPTPLVHPPRKVSKFDPWHIYSHIITFWAPDFILKRCGRGMKSAVVRQAWREKIGLFAIALVLWGFVAFYTLVMRQIMCPESTVAQGSNLIHFDDAGVATLGIQGWQFNVSTSLVPENGPNFYKLASSHSGQDITPFFNVDESSVCSNLKAQAATQELCYSTNGFNGCPLGNLSTATLNQLQLFNTSKMVGFSWDQIGLLTNAMVINGIVLNLDAYMNANPNPITNDSVDAAIRTILRRPGAASGGRDATHMFTSRSELKAVIPCISAKYGQGVIDRETAGCFFSSVLLYVTLVVIFALVLVRFAMACVFSWFISWKLSKTPKVKIGGKRWSPYLEENNTPTKPKPAKRSPRKGVEMVEMRDVDPFLHRWNINTDSANNTPTKPNGKGILKKLPNRTFDDWSSPAAMATQLYTILMVTAYSEGEAGLLGTISSLAETQYSDERKLIIVVCDGLVCGQGESRTTPDIVVSLMEHDYETFGEPTDQLYLSVGAGEKAINRAKVYAGYFSPRGSTHRTPMLCVVKTGVEGETGKKGNRGKRDSQMVVAGWLNRVMYNERMSPLDYDIFGKVKELMGITPDCFELLLMVDADTRVYPDSLRMLVNCMQNDPLTMGLCGETRIANKRESWVTMIQVFEYYISHHLGKGFESVFGGVTCLPGCFSMYRLKALKRDADGAEKWVPILLKPEIVQEYSESVVDTLHQKNLLLLGEDRFLSTLMLRNFPHRKMMFCPQAVCKTVIPSSLSVLLSQRRRWINSTLHNLMELVRVRNLCGTFCFSMQFVVLTDLIGTVVLPAAISLTIVLIVKAIMSPPKDFADAIPLLMLGLVLGLPGFLILITTRKLVYVFWMAIYLLALPIWNFVLPLYALMKMDDFSWGDTRKVVGDGKKGHGHGEVVDVVGESLAGTVPLKRWEDWEKISKRRMKRETARVRELAISAPSHYGTSFHPASEDGTLRTNTTYSGRTNSMAVPPIPSRFLGGRESDLSGVISPPPPSHALDVDEEEYYSRSPAFSNYTLNASTTSLDDYSQNYASRGGNHSVLLPPLPQNPYTNPAGYSTPHAHNYPFENTESYPVYGDRNPLTRTAAPPAGADDGQWRPSVLQQQTQNEHKGGWFSKWGNRRGGSGSHGDNERGYRGGRPGTSWFDDDD